MKTLEQLGERKLLSRLVNGLPGRSDVLVGAGDDCAVTRLMTNKPCDLLLKSDPVVEGIHFMPDARAEHIGRKALARVLSDMAAMGGTPLWTLVNLVAPGHTTWKKISGIRRGLAGLARHLDIAWVGGDVSAGPVLELHVFCVGQIPHGAAVLRSSAQTGDAIYVTGTLGGSISGKHLRFEPRLDQGQWLRTGRWASAMMDLSDGLAMDMPRLAMASQRGAEIWIEKIPVSAAARNMGDGQSSVSHAMNDGEDYELLFTVPKAKLLKFEAAWKRHFSLRCTRIGRITGGKQGSVMLAQNGKTKCFLKDGGYEHFKIT